MRPSDDRSAPGVGSLLAALSAPVLVGSLFLTWYTPVVRPGRQGLPPRQNALEAFGALDLLLVLLAVAAAALGVAALLGRRLVVPSAAVAAFGGVMTVEVLVRLLDPPFDTDLVRLRPGAYLGLVAAAGITAGAALTLYGARGGRWRRAAVGPLPEVAGLIPRQGRSVLALGAVALLGLYLASRISFIDRFPYFFDEGLYGNFAYQGANDLGQLFVSFTIGREPLPIWLAIPFVKLGFNPLDAVRVVGLLCGIGSIAVIGLLARRVYGNAAGVVAAAVYVVLPFFVVNDGIGVTEPVLILVVSAALLLQIELARRPDLRVAVLLAAVFFAAWLTKESAKPALALLPLSLLCFDWSAADRRRRLRTWGMGVAIVVLGVVCAELVLRSSSMYDQLQAARATPFYPVRTISEALVQPGVGWERAWPVYRDAFTGYVTIPLLAAALAGAALGLARARERRRTLLLLAWIAVPFTISVLFTNLPYPRHVLYLMPPAIPLMAHGLVEGGKWVRRSLPSRAGAVAVGAAALLLLVPALRLDAEVLADPAAADYPSRDEEQYVTATGAGSVWPAVAESIERRGRGSQVVALLPSAQKSVLQFILGPESRYELVKGESPLAPRAQFAVYDQNTGPLVNQAAHREAQRRGFVPLESFERPEYGTVVTLFGPPPRRPPYTLARGSISSATGERLRIVPGAVRGLVEERRVAGGKLLLRGWAANLRRGRAARYVLVFSGDRFVAVAPPTVARVDLRRRTNIVALQRAGFLAEVPLARLGRGGRRARLQVFAVDGRVASRLPVRGQR